MPKSGPGSASQPGRAARRLGLRTSFEKFFHPLFRVLEGFLFGTLAPAPGFGRLKVLRASHDWCCGDTCKSCSRKTGNMDGSGLGIDANSRRTITVESRQRLILGQKDIALEPKAARGSHTSFCTTLRPGGGHLPSFSLALALRSFRQAVCCSLSSSCARIMRHCGSASSRRKCGCLDLALLDTLAEEWAQSLVVFLRTRWNRLLHRKLASHYKTQN